MAESVENEAFQFDAIWLFGLDALAADWVQMRNSLFGHMVGHAGGILTSRAQKGQREKVVGNAARPKHQFVWVFRVSAFRQLLADFRVLQHTHLAIHQANMAHQLCWFLFLNDLKCSFLR